VRAIASGVAVVRSTPQPQEAAALSKESTNWAAAAASTAASSAALGASSPASIPAAGPGDLFSAISSTPLSHVHAEAAPIITATKLLRTT
jgi:hypothetical protein